MQTDRRMVQTHLIAILCTHSGGKVITKTGYCFLKLQLTRSSAVADGPYDALSVEFLS